MSQHRFVAMGPFDVPKVSSSIGRSVDFENATRSVFEQANRQRIELNLKSDIDEAIGCYILCLSPPGTKKVWPYYVGQACGQTIKKRLFQKTDKLDKFNDIINQYNKSRVLVYILPLITPSGRLASLGSNQDKINRAEYELIGICARKNYDLWNVKHKVALESFYIDGVHDKAYSKPAEYFQDAIGMSSPSYMPKI